VSPGRLETGPFDIVEARHVHDPFAVGPHVQDIDESPVEDQI